MKRIEKIKLNEKAILKKMKSGEMKEIKGGLYNCLACGSRPENPACFTCYA